jgi:hypothetical protein
VLLTATGIRKATHILVLHLVRYLIDKLPFELPVDPVIMARIAENIK